jgi:hypothetical protein
MSLLVVAHSRQTLLQNVCFPIHCAAHVALSYLFAETCFACGPKDYLHGGALEIRPEFVIVQVDGLAFKMRACLGSVGSNHLKRGAKKTRC